MSEDMEGMGSSAAQANVYVKVHNKEWTFEKDLENDFRCWLFLSFWIIF
jgi:hypothetical protein